MIDTKIDRKLITRALVKIAKQEIRHQTDRWSDGFMHDEKGWSYHIEPTPESRKIARELIKHINTFSR